MRTLTLEINDKNVRASLLSFEHDKTILKTKEYFYQDIDFFDNTFSFDFSWIKKIKNDFNYGSNNSLQDIRVIFNASMTYIDTEVIDIDLLKTDDYKLEVKKYLKEKFPNQYLIDTSFFLKKNKLHFTYELINNDFFTFFKNVFDLNGLKTFSVDSFINIHLKAISSHTNLHRNIISITTNENNLIFSSIENGQINAIYKKNYGIKNIIQNISSKMHINDATSKKMFEMIATIPPEDVIDNRIIYSRTTSESEHKISYSKKDLSTYVSEGVNDLFVEFYSDYVDYAKDDSLILFSGEITDLTGFANYASKKLNSKKIEIFKTNKIGMNSSKDFLTYGFINDFKVVENIKNRSVNFNKNKEKEHSYAIRLFRRFLTYTS